MKMRFDEFLSTYEEINPEDVNDFCNCVIDQLINSNPNARHMSRADWLTYAMYHYNVILDDMGCRVEPILTDEEVRLIYQQMNK